MLRKQRQDTLFVKMVSSFRNKTKGVNGNIVKTVALKAVTA